MPSLTCLNPPTEGTTPRVNPHKNYGLLVIAICQRQSSIVTNVPLVGDVDKGGGVHMGWGAENIWETSITLNFAVNL